MSVTRKSSRFVSPCWKQKEDGTIGEEEEKDVVVDGEEGDLTSLPRLVTLPTPSCSNACGATQTSTTQLIVLAWKELKMQDKH